MAFRAAPLSSGRIVPRVTIGRITPSGTRVHHLQSTRGLWPDMRRLQHPLDDCSRQCFRTMPYSMQLTELELEPTYLNITGKANYALGFAKRKINTRSEKIRSMAYKALVRPRLEYWVSVWDPHTQCRAVSRGGGGYLVSVTPIYCSKNPY